MFQVIPGPPDLKETLLLPDPVSPAATSTRCPVSPVATSTRLLLLPSQSHPPPKLSSPDHFLFTFRKSFYSSCHLTAPAHFRSSLQDWHLLPFSHRAPAHIRFRGDALKGCPPTPILSTSLPWSCSIPPAQLRAVISVHPVFLIVHLGNPHISLPGPVLTPAARYSHVVT